MEVPILLGAAVYLARDMWKPPQKSIDPSDAENDAQMLQRPDQFLMSQLQTSAMIYPSFQFAPTRVPWDVNMAPYYITRRGEQPGDITPDKMRQTYINAQEHYRKDYEEAVASGQQQFVTKSAQPLYRGFTPEVHNIADPSMRTQNMKWAWLIAGPTDADVRDAGALARRVPPNPLLFTPDAYFATAPGLPFRYSNY